MKAREELSDVEMTVRAADLIAEIKLQLADIQSTYRTLARLCPESSLATHADNQARVLEGMRPRCDQECVDPDMLVSALGWLVEERKEIAEAPPVKRAVPVLKLVAK